MDENNKLLQIVISIFEFVNEWGGGVGEWKMAIFYSDTYANAHAHTHTHTYGGTFEHKQTNPRDVKQGEWMRTFMIMLESSATGFFPIHDFQTPILDNYCDRMKL